MNSVADIWQIVLDYLRRDLSETTIKTWFDETEAVEMQEKVFFISCPNAFKLQVIESKYAAKIQEALRDIFSSDYEVRLLSASDVKSRRDGPKKKPASIFESEEYTFDTFVVGESNKLAHAAARAVADGVGEHYNPLFIYGDSGLGKTHLIYAIAHQFGKTFPGSRIVYVKGDDFLNEFINMVRGGHGGEEFRRKYRVADLLLVDDVQFVAGKDQVQVEFFNTFNTLYESKHHIVLTSDRLPSEMTLLDERLRTRFEWGLMADVHAPDYETRVAIIKNKALQRGLVMDDRSADYIAKNVTSNVRQIEGVINSIKAHSAMDKGIINSAEIETIVRESVRQTSESIPTPEIIISEVSRYFHLQPDVLRGRDRKRDIANARNIAMYLVQSIVGLSTTEIGKVFGNRDHSTVVNSLDRVTSRLDTDPALAQTIKDISLNVNAKN